MFIDKAKIVVKSGKGGDGAVAFRREKYVPNGGPNGGDGGKGGDVIIKATDDLNTLEPFRYKKNYAANPGKDGMGSNMSGKNGEDIIILVPVGTVIFNSRTGELIRDMVEDCEGFIILEGGRGGRGNQHFATSTRQSPKFSKPGDEAEELELILELKTIADVGLIGFPNVGKSTLLSMVTNAKPKIANYHFTTLTPNLGIVKFKNAKEFILADIPGLIEGASKGQGLGHYFLRHIERTRLLIHVLDVSGIEGRDPIEDFNIINNELKNYSHEMIKRTQIIALNKTDLIINNEGNINIKKYEQYFENKGYKVFKISAATNTGIKDLLEYTVKILPNIERKPLFFTEEEKKIYSPSPVKEYKIEKKEDIYYITGKMMRRLIGSVNFADYESSNYFQRVLKNKGIFEELEEIGIKEGDTVEVEGYQFEYFK